MQRSLSFPIYVLALIITIIMFAIGVYVGTLVDSINLNGLRENLNDITADVSSMQLLLLSDEPELFCPVYANQLSKVNSEIETIGYKLTVLEEEKGIVDVDLKKQFFILEANSYLLSKKTNGQCNKNTTLILYFYSNKNCESCQKQGLDLTEARRHSSNTLTYSFDGDLGSPIADAFKQKYDISVYPTIIINDQRFIGYTPTDKLRAALG